MEEQTTLILDGKTAEELEPSLAPLERAPFSKSTDQMIVSYNFQLTEEKNISLPLKDRAFSYGDGLFETLIFRKGKIQFFKDHMRRLKEGMKALGYEGVNGLKKSIVKQQLKNLIKKNGIADDARLKIQVWRKWGGLYFPENLHFNIVMMAMPIEVAPNAAKPLKMSFSDTVRLHFTPFSKFKTINALPYIVASLERRKKDVDDLVLLDSKGNVAECTSSNIFWVKSGKFYTPRLKTGCVDGVARKNLIKHFEGKGFKVNKVKAPKEDLLKADHVFISNVSGIRQVHQIDDKAFEPFPPINKLW